jgi:TonB family protein
MKIDSMKTKMILGLLVISLSAFAQDKDKKQSKVQKGFGVSVTQVQPEFPGGIDSLQAFLNENLSYPEKAKREHIQGKVYVGFLVDRNGKIKNPKILSTASEELDNEALRVVGLMPDWIPGTAGGSPVDVQYILPIDFIAPPIKTRDQQ